MSIIGIDFGTTKTLAYIFRNNQFEIIPDRKGRFNIPSLVLISPEEEIFVGWEAKLHPQRYESKHITINSVKRIIGKEQDCNWGNWRTHPQEIASLILGRLKIEVEEYLGYEVNNAVIAIPAHFDINQRWAVIQAAEIAGFKVRRLVNEATAAAISHCYNISTDGSAIVVDIGGGTTDVSIIFYGDGIIEVISTSGDHYLGGDDFDQSIVNHIKSILKNRGEDVGNFTPIQEFVLRNNVTNAKTELSESLSTQIFLPAFIKRVGKKYDDLNYILRRDQFNELIDYYLKRILVLIDEAKTKADNILKERNIKQLDKLILVGGSSRIPKIREMISQHIALRPQGNIDPELCVSKGAAAEAAVISGELKDLLLLDAIPSSLSVEDSDGYSQVILGKNETIPTKTSKVFSAILNNKTELEIRIFEGENKLAKNNTYIGSINFPGISQNENVNVKVEVEIDVDANGTIYATVRDTSNKFNQMRTILSSPFKLNQSQINVMSNAVSEVMKKYKNN
jgi:molecular chaperone DnaK